jgi:hypothetical protein
MPEVDLTQWPSVEEAAVALRTSARSIIRHNERGELEFRKRPRPGKKPENVVNPADLEKLKPAPYPVKMPAPQFSPEPRQIFDHSAMNRFVSGLAEAVASHTRALPPAPEPAAAPRPEPPAVALDRKLWLTLPEASVYSGISSSKLRAAANEGLLRARPDGPRGALIIKRASLEEFAG